jgi:hypothetical protein
MLCSLNLLLWGRYICQFHHVRYSSILHICSEACADIEERLRSQETGRPHQDVCKISFHDRRQDWIPATKKAGIKPDLPVRLLTVREKIHDCASNKSFSEWCVILGNNVMVAAVLDRILHHCTVVNIKGKSYRLKDRRKNSLPTMRRE